MILKNVKAIIINSSTKRGARKEITGGSEDLAGLPWCLWLHSPKDLGCVCSKQHTQRCLQFRFCNCQAANKKKFLQCSFSHQFIQVMGHVHPPLQNEVMAVRSTWPQQAP
jgi:hypothetical protein